MCEADGATRHRAAPERSRDPALQGPDSARAQFESGDHRIGIYLGVMRRETNGQEAASIASVSAARFEKPHSLSYQEATFTWLPITRMSPASKIDECASPTMSDETSGSSEYSS